MNWYEELDGVRIISRRRPVPKRLTSEAERLLIEEKNYYRNKLYEEWDRLNFFDVNYTPSITDIKDYETFNTFRTLDITPKRMSYRLVMDETMCAYLKEDVKRNSECINRMIDKTIVEIQKDLKEQVVHCLNNSMK